jgi:hypothetical protein
VTRPMPQCERCAIRSYQKLENDCADAERRVAEAEKQMDMLKAAAAPVIGVLKWRDEIIKKRAGLATHCHDVVILQCWNGECYRVTTSQIELLARLCGEGLCD